MQRTACAQQKHQYRLGWLGASVWLLLCEDARLVLVQASSGPLRRLQHLVLLLQLFQLVAAVYLSNERGGVVSDQQKERIGDARAEDSGLGARLFIQHREDLAKPKVWKLVSRVAGRRGN